MRDYSFDSRGGAFNHDVNQQAGLRHRLAAKNPCAANFAHGVVKRDAAVATRSNLPTENLSVKRGRLINVNRWNLDITDFPVSQGWLPAVFQSVSPIPGFAALDEVTELTTQRNQRADSSVA
jgi:hypothetical protein